MQTIFIEIIKHKFGFVLESRIFLPGLCNNFAIKLKMTELFETDVE